MRYRFGVNRGRALVLCSSLCALAFCLVLAQKPASSRQLDGAGDVRGEAKTRPVIVSASFDGANVTLSGTLGGLPNTTCDLEFFSSAECCGHENRDFQNGIGAMVATTDGNGRVNFGPVSFPLPSGHSFVVAAAMAPNDKIWTLSGCVPIEGTSPPCVPLPAQVGGWWPGEGGANDISNQGNSGTLGWGASFAPGKVGQAFSLNGPDARVEIPDAPSLNPAAITLVAWIEPKTLGSASRIVTKEMDATQCVEPDVVYSLEAHGDLGSRPAFFFTTSDYAEHALWAKSAIRPGVFTHLAVTFDGHTAKIYVNGVLESSQAVEGVLASSVMPLVIGNGGSACRAALGRSVRFDGLIDEVEMFDRALSESEIQTIFEAGCNGNCKPPSPGSTPGPDSSPTPAPTPNADPSPSATVTATATPIATRPPKTPTNDITWTGGGVTNNWSEGANWTGGVIPGMGDIAIFDGTSTKNATVDTSVSIQGLHINAGYTGTIAEASGTTLSISNSFVQSDGTFVCGSGATIFFDNVVFTQSAGVFNCTDGTFDSHGILLTLNQGRFEAPAGTMTLGAQFGGSFTKSAGATFNHNNGTIILNGTNFDFFLPGGILEINNLTDNLTNFVGTHTNNLRVTGTLALNDGGIAGMIEAQGDVVIASTFGNPGANAGLLQITGSASRMITLPTLSPDPNVRINPIELNAPNVTLNTSGPGPIKVVSLNLIDGTVNIGPILFSLGAGSGFSTVSQSGGAFNCDIGSTLFFDGVDFVQTGGSFNCQSGTIDSSYVNLTLSGGVFNAPFGTMTLNAPFGGSFTKSAGAIFNHNNGTIVLGGTNFDFNLPAGILEINNLTDNLSNFVGTHTNNLRVTGTLTLNDGGIVGTIEAQGDVVVASTFGNPGANAGLLQITGSASRTITLPTLSPDPSVRINPIELNAPNVTLNTSGPGPIKLVSLNLIDGTVNIGPILFSLGTGSGFTTVSQSGGAFNCDIGSTLFFDGVDFVQTGGLFNCQSSTIDSSYVNLTLSGGIFNAPLGTMTLNAPFGGSFTKSAGATFNHDGGTLILSGNNLSFRLSGGTLNLGNLAINVNAFVDFSNQGGTLRVSGALNLVSGAISGGGPVGTVVAEGDVTVGSGFGSSNNTANFTFSGSDSQTYVNNGGTNSTGLWTIDKPAGTVTAATSFILGTNQPLNINSGMLFLGNNSNLTCGALTVGANGALVSDSSTTITLGGDVANGGIIDLQAGSCPGADTILLRSSSPGTRRNWSGGSGARFRMVNVNVQDQRQIGLCHCRLQRHGQRKQRQLELRLRLRDKRLHLADECLFAAKRDTDVHRQQRRGAVRFQHSREQLGSNNQPEYRILYGGPDSGCHRHRAGNRQFRFGG